MSDATAAGLPTPGAPARTDRGDSRFVDELILDRIDALKVLRADTDEAKGAFLEKITLAWVLIPLAIWLWLRSP